MRIEVNLMAQQWRKGVCALLIGALREKLKRKWARFGFFPKEHQCAMTRKNSTGSASIGKAEADTFEPQLEAG